MNQYVNGVPTEAYLAALLRRDVESRDNPQPWHGPDRDRDPWEPEEREMRPLGFTPPMVEFETEKETT